LSFALCEPAASQAAQQALQLLNVGVTGITCLRLPCPHRGVFLPGGSSLQARRAALLYADIDGRTDPPHLVSAPDIVMAVSAAWSDMKCVQVLGRLEPTDADRPTLYIARVVGRCP